MIKYRVLESFTLTQDNKNDIEKIVKCFTEIYDIKRFKIEQMENCIRISISDNKDNYNILFIHQNGQDNRLEIFKKEREDIEYTMIYLAILYYLQGKYNNVFLVDDYFEFIKPLNKHQRLKPIEIFKYYYPNYVRILEVLEEHFKLDFQLVKLTKLLQTSDNRIKYLLISNSFVVNMDKYCWDKHDFDFSFLNITTDPTGENLFENNNRVIGLNHNGYIFTINSNELEVVNKCEEDYKATKNYLFQLVREIYKLPTENENSVVTNDDLKNSYVDWIKSKLNNAINFYNNRIVDYFWERYKFTRSKYEFKKSIYSNQYKAKREFNTKNLLVKIFNYNLGE